ncbi:toxin glutamine deamidase domain-containing protein [Actinoallomurus purpureus]|uniref:toxin glutamine deamidase domain-containing protein n=1 Tax=Actinoallomurus purpureus TaxID=478114 RepID=UPI0020925D58|nr:toxin glutamine deamidase domain-containing protein [Actinoallomurus purpureus]MCO6008288.1 toxin glutamine deamidase domain-containing protein [Actinoallomurus purpureus]
MAADRSSHDTDVETVEKSAADRRPPPPPPDRPGTPGFPSRAESRTHAAEANRQSERTDEGNTESGQAASEYANPTAISGHKDKSRKEFRQRTVGEKMTNAIEKDINKKIDQTLDEVNPKFDKTKSAYSENCTGVVQANELRRRGLDVQAGPLEKHLRTDEGGPGGRSLDAIERSWGRKFTDGTKTDIENAFREPGSRGIVYIRWHGGMGAHVFSAENVGGKVRFVDGQPTPSARDASHYFNLGSNTKYLRVDDIKTPDPRTTKPYLEP